VRAAVFGVAITAGVIGLLASAAAQSPVNEDPAMAAARKRQEAVKSFNAQFKQIEVISSFPVN
jgi:outer membrane lipoprotein-sorting protein